MSQDKPVIGDISWIDLTVDKAEDVNGFYKAVVGWKDSPVSMGDYDDYCMIPPANDNPVAGICHAQGGNSGLPAQWLIYINVEDLDKSIKACQQNGGELVAGPKDLGKSGRYCVIKDPAGAISALFEHAG